MIAAYLPVEPTVEHLLASAARDESNLLRHARQELQLAGLLDDDADYGPDLADCILKVVQAFSSYGHSGGSAMLVTEAVNRLLRFETLTPIDSRPEHWMKIADELTGGEDLWQSTRDPRYFSNDGGKSWYHLNDEGKRVEG